MAMRGLDWPVVLLGLMGSLIQFEIDRKIHGVNWKLVKQKDQNEFKKFNNNTFDNPGTLSVDRKFITYI